MAERLLIIDDDARLAAMLSDYLSAAGFVVERRFCGLDGLAALESAAFDAVILDVMLPDIDGFEVCRRIRARTQTPILMLTARREDTDRIVELEIGADDYLPKPFNPRELQARIRAILRRGRVAAGAPEAMLRFGRLQIDRRLPHGSRRRGGAASHELSVRSSGCACRKAPGGCSDASA